MSDPRFLACIPLILKEEGGNSNDAHDPGGATHKGIIQKEYDIYRRMHGLSTQSVFSATDAEVYDIYEHQYWQPFAPKMWAGLDLVYFDQAVNEGPGRAAILLQRALGVTDDGHIGLITLNAINVALNKSALVKAYSDQRRAFYRGLRNFRYFGKGWLERTQRIETAALAMLQTGA